MNSCQHTAVLREDTHGLERFGERDQQCASSVGNVCGKIEVLIIPTEPLPSRNGNCGLRFIILISLKLIALHFALLCYYTVHCRPQSGQKATVLPCEYFIGLSAVAIGFQISHNFTPGLWLLVTIMQVCMSTCTVVYYINAHQILFSIPVFTFFYYSEMPSLELTLQECVSLC